jgi:hypothetical protein
MLNGKKWAQSHQASVDAILDGSEGREKRTVSARGDGFFNIDRWTARILWSKLCQSVRYGNTMSGALVADALWHANQPLGPRAEIVVADVPDRVPAWLARSSIGGNYHEAWHTEWSCRRDLTVAEVWGPLQQRWALIPEAEWSRFIQAVLTWSNIIEDIRIERLGCAKYPGAPDKMRDLQDLILKMESGGQEANAHKAVGGGADDMSVIMGAFRDLGLGYQSERQLAVLDTYQQRSPTGWAMVTEGALKPLLDRSIALGADDDLGSFWIALEVIAVLRDLLVSMQEQEQEQESGPSGQPGQPPQTDDYSEMGPPDDSDDEGKGKGVETPFQLFKVGDRAKTRDGTLVEVTFAGLPDKNGRQALKWSAVLPD